MSSRITEILPDDMPEWADEGIASGQFFRVCLSRVAKLEDDLSIATTEAVEKQEGMVERGREILKLTAELSVAIGIIEDCGIDYDEIVSLQPIQEVSDGLLE